jgi:hypothetical protein
MPNVDMFDDKMLAALLFCGSLMIEWCFFITVSQLLFACENFLQETNFASNVSHCGPVLAYLSYCTP